MHLPASRNSGRVVWMWNPNTPPQTPGRPRDAVSSSRQRQTNKNFHDLLSFLPPWLQFLEESETEFAKCKEEANCKVVRGRSSHLCPLYSCLQQVPTWVTEHEPHVSQSTVFDYSVRLAIAITNPRQTRKIKICSCFYPGAKELIQLSNFKGLWESKLSFFKIAAHKPQQPNLGNARARPSSYPPTHTSI